MEALSEQKILESWKKNVSPWTKAIQLRQIESRRVVTDQVIIEAIESLAVKSIIDIGCGEGWLLRELCSRGFLVTGIDAIKDFVDQAMAQGSSDVHVMEYQKLVADSLQSQYHAAVCNFSLLGKESVEHVFKTIPTILNERGYFIIQTLHPHVSCGMGAYVDGWRAGSWSGFSKAFVDPAPWFFRTLSSWFELYRSSGFELIKIEEPINPKTGEPVSLLMIGRKT